MWIKLKLGFENKLKNWKEVDEILKKNNFFKKINFLKFRWILFWREIYKICNLMNWDIYN